MKFNFKKITPIAISAVLLGSTIGFATVMADLASYPSPFVASGASDLSIIYGVDGKAKDMEAAGLFSSDLASELADQTAGDSSSSTSLSGESVNLATSNTKIYYGTELDAAKPTITKTDMPTLLADGSVIDDSGTEYEYTQAIDLGTKANKGRNFSFTKSGEAIDPIAAVDIGYSASLPLYNYSVTFKKQINLSSTDVQGNTIKILGTDYTIGSGSDFNTLVLYGAGTKVTVEEGEEKTVTVVGTDHTIQLEGTDTSTTGVMIFDGVRKSVTEGNSYKFTGEVEVYIKDIFHQTKTGVASSAEFLVGSTKLKLDGAGSVKKGADETSTLNTYITIDPNTDNAGRISGFAIAQASGSSIGDYLQAGEYYEDRVFSNLKLEFSALNPALDASTRDEIIVDTDNSANAKVTFTTALSDKSFTMYFGHDIDATGSNTNLAVKLADSANFTIHVIENATINLNEYAVVDAGDKGRILKLTAIGSGTSTSDKTKFEDVITGEAFEFNTGMDNKSFASIDGQIYYVRVENPGSNPQNVTINWGTSSTYGQPGIYSVFPRIKLKKGGWLAFLTETVVTSDGNNAFILPGYEVLTTHESGLNWSSPANRIGNTSNYMSAKYGNVNWTMSNTSGAIGSGNFSIFGISNAIGAWATATGCNFTSTSAVISDLRNKGYDDIKKTNSSQGQGPGPAILLLEEHKLGETDGDAICIPLTSAGSTETHVAVGTPLHTDLADMGSFTFHTLNSDSYKSQALDIYGTWFERDTSSGTDYSVKVKYPDEQMFADIFLAELSAESSVTTPSSGITKLGDVLLSDDEAESSKPSTNLIVIGGSAVNKVSADMLGLTYPTMGGDTKWQDATGVTGEGQAIIKLFASPYSADKKAMLVAGWEADDTIAAAKQVINKKSSLADMDSKVIKKGVDYS